MILHQGYIPTPPAQLDKVYKQLDAIQGGALFGDVAGHLTGLGAGKLSTPFKSVMKFCPTAFGDDAQTGPDCTTHGTRNASDIPRAVEIDIKGEPESWEARGATEALYGYRGHTGGGMNPGLATEFVVKHGLLLRKKYDFADLSKYNFSIGDRWGQNGPPQACLDEADKHPCKFFLRLTSVEQARDALAAGYGIHGGSQYGNDGKRNSKGVARFNGSWNHDMAWGAADETGDDLYFMVLQSWGDWNSGGHPDWGPLPTGAFLIPSADANYMIRNGEFWAIGDTVGWPARELPNYGSGDYL